MNLRRRDRLDEIAAEAIEAFDAAKIETLLLKGAALADVLYGPADLERSYFDIDLLIAPRAQATAARVLTSLGFGNVSAERGIADVAEILHAEGWSRLDPEIGNAMIDLHWKLDGCREPPEIVWGRLRSGAEPTTVAGRRVLRLGTPALALHTALHLAQHGCSDAKATADLNVAVRRWSRDVWVEAAQLAVAVGATDAFAVGLRQSADGTRVADSLGVFPTDTAAWDMAHRDETPRGAHYVNALARTSSPKARATVVQAALLPSPA